jgi:ABC-2 type transport system ATP-binding protein
VSQTVDHVVIMDRGRLVTSASLAELTTQPDVVVRSPEADRLRSELSHLGIDVTAADDVVTASGTTPEQVGRVIGRLGLVVYEMRLEQADLEDVFFSLTAASEGAMT